MKIRSGVWSVWLALVNALIGQTASFGGEELPLETGKAAQAHWNYLVSAWRSEREKLKSYEVHVKGWEQRYDEFAKSPPHDLIKPTTRHKVDLRIVRDDPTRRMKTEVHWGDGVQSAGAWLRASDHVAEWVATRSSPVLLIAPTTKRQYFAIKFEPEAVGVFGVDDFREFATEDLLGLGFDILSRQLPLISLRSLDGGRIEAHFRQKIAGTEKFRNHYVCTREEQGSAIEYRKYTASGSATSVADPIDGEIYVDWAKKGELWLPSRLRETRRSGLSTVDLAFDWISVNAPIRDGEFDLDSIGAPPGTTIADQRLGTDRPIILGQVGGPVPVQVVKLPSPFLRPTTIALLALGACLSGLAVLGLLLAWRWGRSASRIGGARS